MIRITTAIVCLCIMLLIYVVELGLIFCDLVSGVRKAKAKGIYKTSEGYKRTIDKIAKYFVMTFSMSLVDVVMLAIVYMLWYFYKVDIWMIPVFTIIGGGYVAFVEITSIWEPADVKEKKLVSDYKKVIIQLLQEYGSAEKVISIITDMAIKNSYNDEKVQI